MKETFRLVALKLTYKCNLNCFMCGQRKTKKTVFNQELDLEKIKQILSECGNLDYGVYLWGGESLLYSNINELLEYLFEHKIFTVINTNGTRLHKIEDLVCRADSFVKLIVSIDGTEATHDAIRGVKGTFNRIEENVKRLNSKRKKNIIISSNTVVTSENYQNLHEIISTIKNMGMDYMECQLPIYFEKSCGALYEKRIRDAFGQSADSWKGFQGDYSNMNLPELISEFEKLQKTFKRKVRFTPNLDAEGLYDYFGDAQKISKDLSCSLLYHQLSIEPNGDVVVCPDFPDYIIGNIYESSITDIWHGERMNQFRNLMEEEKLPICKRCCNLYQF